MADVLSTSLNKHNLSASPIESLKLALEWSQYQEMNSVPSSLMADGLVTWAPRSGFGIWSYYLPIVYLLLLFQDLASNRKE